MRSMTLAGFIAGSTLLAAAAPCVAQRPVTLGVAVGAAVPVSDLSESHTTGYHVAAHLGIEPSSLPFGVRLEGFYNVFGARVEEIVGDARFRVVAGSVNLVHPLGATSIRPYLIGGVGVYNAKYIRYSTTADVGFNAGLGTRFQAAGFKAFAEARLHLIREDQPFWFVPVTLGIEF